MDKIKILWADDEIELLKPQLLFLEKKGYDVLTVSNGYDALEECEEHNDIDVVFLDESMPGITGLETLSKIKDKSPHLPVVMITKNEAENVMEEALGQQISDYLIKPVNPNQILLTLKKIIDNKRLVKERTTSDYQQEFRQILTEINNGLDYRGWGEVYKKIISWELKLDASNTTEMSDIISMQKTEANNTFSKFIDKNYLRFDQWKILEPIISELYRVEEEDFFYSILPTSTQYSRNSIFSGLMPSEIAKKFPDWWKNDIDEGGKNNHEEDLLEEQINRTFRKPITFGYTKVTNMYHAKKMNDNILNYLNNDLTVIVYNFIDMLSHARTEMEVLKELAGDETAYRSLTKSWFLHSTLWEALQRIAERDVQLIITTDHGTIRVKTPSKVIGDRETTTNLRYKLGKNLNYDKRDVLEVRDPKKAFLPRPNVSSTFIFAKEDKYFLYPNNYNYYNNYYRNTFQHGGISLEEFFLMMNEK